MASQRITRETFDAVVQEKIKRYRISLDQAIAETIQEFQLDGSSKNLSRMPVENYESMCRDSDRFRDLQRDSFSRNWELEKRREDIARQSYQLRELGRDKSPGRVGDSFLDRLRSQDVLLKERLLQEAANRRMNDLDSLQARERSDLLTRDLDYGSRRWELERNALRSSDYNMVRSDVFRDLRSTQQSERFGQRTDYAGPVQNEFRSPGSRGKMATNQTRGGAAQRGGGAKMQMGRVGQSGSGTGTAIYKAGESSTKHQESDSREGKPADEDDQSLSGKCSLQLIRWSKFISLVTDNDLVKQHKALFKVKTEACKMIVECFKCPMTAYHTDQCFSAVKFLGHPALKNPKIDNELLDLLMEKKAVKSKNHFFEAIKPFDKELMTIQQRILRSVIPLLMACNTYELKHSILTDQRQLLGALKSTVFLCRKTMVLLGQTFALTTISRQKNILKTLGLSEMGIKPSDYPNMKDSFLFGKEFIGKLKDWLKRSGNKMELKACTQLEKTENDEEHKIEIESKVKKEADPTVAAQIDQLLEYAKRAEGEKPAFWFLFDKESSEYIYYRQKLAEFQKSTGQIRVNDVQTKKPRKSPEDLACESVRAMLYARKAQAIKRKTFKCLAYSRRHNIRELRKCKVRPSKKVSVKSEPMEVSCEDMAEKIDESKPSAASSETSVTTTSNRETEVSTPTSDLATASDPDKTTTPKSAVPASTPAKNSVSASTPAKSDATASAPAKSTTTISTPLKPSAASSAKAPAATTTASAKAPAAAATASAKAPVAAATASAKAPVAAATASAKAPAAAATASAKAPAAAATSSAKAPAAAATSSAKAPAAAATSSAKAPAAAATSSAKAPAAAATSSAKAPAAAATASAKAPAAAATASAKAPAAAATASAKAPAAAATASAKAPAAAATASAKAPAAAATASAKAPAAAATASAKAPAAASAKAPAAAATSTSTAKSAATSTTKAPAAAAISCAKAPAAATSTAKTPTIAKAASAAKASAAAAAKAPAASAAKAPAAAAAKAPAAAAAKAPAAAAAKAPAAAAAKAPAAAAAKAPAAAAAKAPAASAAKAPAASAAKAPAASAAKAPAASAAKAPAASAAKAPAASAAKAPAAAAAKAPVISASAKATTTSTAKAPPATPPSSSTVKASAVTSVKNPAITSTPAKTPTPSKSSIVTSSAARSPASAKFTTQAKVSETESQEANVKVEPSSESQDLDVDEKTKDTAVKLAQFVVQMGPEIEQFSMENSVNNPEFWFLREKDSPAYKFYKRTVEEFKLAEEDASDEDDELLEDEGELENIRTDDDLLLDEGEDASVDADCEAAEAPSSDNAQVAAFSQMPTPARPQMPRKRVSKLKVGMLPAKRVCLVEEPKVHDPVRIEYDRPRGRGYNRRKKPVDLEFANKKLTQQNVGFKMLSKMGWKEGQGLGSSGSGIKNPIKVGSVSSGEGLGVENKEGGEPQSDNFDVFRQRMMQMYRQKMVK